MNVAADRKIRRKPFNNGFLLVGNKKSYVIINVPAFFEGGRIVFVYDRVVLRNGLQGKKNTF